MVCLCFSYTHSSQIKTQYLWLTNKYLKLKCRELVILAVSAFLTSDEFTSVAPESVQVIIVHNYKKLSLDWSQ